MLRELDFELESIVEEKWAEFESQSQLKRQYLRDDIVEIEQAIDFELKDVHQRIRQVENELRERMQENGVLFNYFQYTGDSQDQCPSPARNWEENGQIAKTPSPEGSNPKVQIPENPSPEESGRSRGFFTNSISADTNALNSRLDPTALAVIGILITLAATAVQLVKGN